MCGGGAARRQHHREQEAMRAATAEANRIEAQQRQFQEELMAMRPKEPEMPGYTPDPFRVRTNSEVSGGNLALRRKQKSSKRTVADLRIAKTPAINTGGVDTSGINLG